MTDKGDNNSDKWVHERSDREAVKRGQNESPDVADTPTREEWESLASDPKLKEDFGYEFGEWEEFATLDDSDTLMFLPSDEEVLREDAFVVVDEGTMIDLGKKY